jgi:hypothetical protein
VTLIYAGSIGVLLGILGGFFAWPQFLFHRLKMNASYYKYYPKSMGKRYFEMELSQSNNEQDIIGKKFDFALGKIKLPHPFFESMLIVLVYLPLLIYLPIKGIFYGPIHSYETWMFYWEDR